MASLCPSSSSLGLRWAPAKKKTKFRFSFMVCRPSISVWSKKPWANSPPKPGKPYKPGKTSMASIPAAWTVPGKDAAGCWSRSSSKIRQPHLGRLLWCEYGGAAPPIKDCPSRFPATKSLRIAGDACAFCSITPSDPPLFPCTCPTRFPWTSKFLQTGHLPIGNEHGSRTSYSSHFMRHVQS